VPAGAGSVEILKLPPSFPNPPPRAPTLSADPRFKLEITGKPGDTVRELNFRLERGKTITLTVLDPEGMPVAGAEVDRRGLLRNLLRQDIISGQTEIAGHCELTGVYLQNGATIDVIHPSRPLGARVVIRSDELDAARAARRIEVRLEPTGSITGRVLDEMGKPLVEPAVQLHTVARYPDRSVVTGAEVRGDGSFTFDRLLAGVSYFVHISAEGHARLISEHIRAKVGEISRLKEFRLPAADQELHGIVVDPRGKPVAAAIVTFQRNADRQLMAPQPGAWSQQTDDQDLFHLTALPKGPLTLLTYRKPDGADRSIRNMVAVDAQARGQRNEVRIVLPDANERLRGIE
jgi:hypothetical protein